MQYRKEEITKMIKETVLRKDPTAQVILFSSRAGSQERKDSDWDILILLNEEIVTRKLQRAFRDKLFGVGLETEELISSLIYSISEWVGKYKGTPLYQNIKTDGIKL